MGYGSYSAAVAEVSLDQRGRVKVQRLVLGIDSGHVVNPGQVEAQVQGSVAYGLGAAFFQEITIKDGRVVETNFDTLEMMRMADFPRVETVIASSGGFWGGVGEPTISVASPAVMNAIFAATGKPVRSLPMKDVKLQRA
jgi:isoquinoline 1-oxidoreductase beta subunit